KTEQSDLNASFIHSHCYESIPVLAVGSVEECFFGAVQAFNWAERYQGPVILLSEHSLAERAQNIPKPDLAATPVESRNVYKGENGYLRYESTEISPFPVPGGAGAYVANGSEHDIYGDTTHLAKYHIHMTERRFSKLKLLEDGAYESDNASASVAVMPWGGSKGSGLEAFRQLRSAGVDIAWYYTMFLNPLPAALLDELRSKDLVLVPELNYQGQFASVLRSLGVRAEAITQYTGLPFRPTELGERIKARLAGAGQPQAVNT
ncbi:MAG: hypothetical protein F4Y96_03985, partial [Chloroflexi bacterium]|nr:hypothetical protein [Chloroflexota bacterium]